MICFIKILLYLFISKTWALTAIQVGSKYSLNHSKSYHFSSKKLISTHINSKNPFIIGLKIGDLTFKENTKTKRVLILSKKQLTFFKNTNFIIKSSPFLQWKIKDKKLLIVGNSRPEEFVILLKHCSLKKLTSVAILTNSNSNPYSNEERNCLFLKKNFKIELAFLNENTLSGSTFGLGIPSELLWSLRPKVQFGDIMGGTQAQSKKNQSKGHSFFTTLIESNEPLVFESGAEILIKSSGLFNNQKNEWKKATSNIRLSILESTNNFIKANFKINKTNQTANSNIFNIEKFEQSNTLKLKQWVHIFTFRQNNQDMSKNKFLNLSLLGIRSKNKSNTNKQFWVRISQSD